MDNNRRSLEDADLTVSRALPAANASASTTAFNVGDGRKPDTVDLVVEVPALPALVEAKKVTITVEDSADNVSFAAIESLAARTITGAVGNGAAASAFRWKLPPRCRKFVRVTAAVETGGGNNTAVSFTAKILN